MTDPMWIRTYPAMQDTMEDESDQASLILIQNSSENEMFRLRSALQVCNAHTLRAQWTCMSFAIRCCQNSSCIGYNRWPTRWPFMIHCRAPLPTVTAVSCHQLSTITRLPSKFPASHTTLVGNVRQLSPCQASLRRH